MRIAIVASDYAPTIGGVQTAARNIARHAAKMGHVVAVLSAQVCRDTSQFEREDDVPIYRFPWGKRPILTLPFRALWTLAALGRVLRDFKPDLVYVHFLSINALYILLLHYVMRFKLVVSARGNDIQGIPQRSRIQRWMLARLFRRAKAILFCSAYLRRQAAPFLRDVPVTTFIGVVGDGFNPDEFASPRAYSHPTPYVLAVGRLVEKKGFDLLIRAFASVSKEFPQIELLIAGDGEERAKLESEIRDLRLENRVRLLGFANPEKTIALFWGSELFVLSSRLEPFGIVVLEAMAAHKAVLATKSGGVIELIEDGVNGWLVEPGVEGLANGLRAMLSRPEETRAMGERAYATIQQRTWAAVTEKFLDVFERVFEKS
jgi:glycosyltransferase involved in cell wall biosynthesis